MKFPALLPSLSVKKCGKIEIPKCKKVRERQNFQMQKMWVSILNSQASKKCGKFQIEFPNVKKCGEIPWILRLVFDADNLLRCSVMWHQNELSIYGEFVPEKISIFKLGYSPLLHLTAWRTHTYLSLVFSAMLWACSHICQEGWNLCAKWDNMTCLCYLHHNITSPLAFLRGKTDHFFVVQE